MPFPGTNHTNDLHVFNQNAESRGNTRHQVSYDDSMRSIEASSFHFDDSISSDLQHEVRRQPVQHSWEIDNNLSDRVNSIEISIFSEASVRNQYHSGEDFNSDLSISTSASDGLDNGVNDWSDRVKYSGQNSQQRAIYRPNDVRNYFGPILAERPISNHNTKAFARNQYYNGEDFNSDLSISTAASDGLDNRVNNCSDRVKYSGQNGQQRAIYRPNDVRNYFGPTAAQKPIPNHYMNVNQPCRNAMSGPHVPQQRFQAATINQTTQHLGNGYSSDSNGIGFQKSLTNIKAPDQSFVNGEGYHLEGSRQSDEHDSTNSFLHTQNLSEQRFESAHSHVPRANTVSADILDRTAFYRTPDPPGQASQPVEKPVKVFVTYAQEAENRHLRIIAQISQTLLSNAIDVSVDVLEETIRSVSISDWLDNEILCSDFVLICVSPSYRQVVDGQSTSTMQQNESAVNTQYIYRRIHAEYINQGSKNYRFIPVLVSGAKGHHIPLWLKDTKVFEWPKDYEDIIYRLLRKEKYLKPKLGSAPMCITERCSDIKSQSNSNQSRNT